MWHVPRKAASYLVFAVLSVVPVLLCQTSPLESTSRGTAERQSAGGRELTADEQSCKAFVQSFYDWYWNRFAAQAESPGFNIGEIPDVWTVLQHRPSVLSPKLRRLLANEEKKMRATHEIGNLDFDPFLNSQDPRGKYVVARTVVTNNRCEATIPQGHIVVEAEKNGSGWQFSNFHYSFYSEDGKTNRFPDGDLIEILSRKN